MDNELQGVQFESAKDLPTAMGAFVAAIQDGNDASAVFHAMQILEFVSPLCREVSRLRERVAELESHVLSCQMMHDEGVADARIVERLLTVFVGPGLRDGLRPSDQSSEERGG